MDLAAPTDFDDYLTDATAIIRPLRARWLAGLGPVTAVTAQVAGGDAGVELLIERPGARPLTVTGTRVAETHDGAWRWLLPEDAAPFPQLTGSQPASDSLLDAAGLIAGVRPTVIVPPLVVAVTADLDGEPSADELIDALACLPESAARRATFAYASAFGLLVAENKDNRSLSLARPDGTPLATVQLSPIVQVTAAGDRPSLNVFDVLADAWYLSAEHQLVFQERFPDPRPRFDLRESVAYLDYGRGSTNAPLKVLATFTTDTFTWAWADPNLPARSAAAERLRTFGRDHGILDLLRPHLPLARTHEIDFAVLAKPVLGSWTHVVAQVAEGVWALGLIDHPSLHLPPGVNPQATATPLPANVPAERALSAYRAARGAAV